MDSVGSGRITTGNKNAKAQGLGVWVRDKATLNLMGGTIDMTGVSSTGYGGVGVAAETGAVVNMSGGAIIGATSIEDYRDEKDKNENKENGGDGANVYVQNKAVFNMSGGEIKDGRTISNISGKSCTGGNVNVLQGGTFNMSGGKISGGVSYGTAGNLAIGGTLNLSGNAEIVGGVSKVTEKNTGGHGGNIYLSGKLNISGGVIKDGDADKQGGNISMNSANSVVNMTNGSILGGTASSTYKNTGSVYIWNNNDTTFNMSGGAITSLSEIPEGKTGGGIALAKGKLNLSGNVNISGGLVNLYVASGMKVNVTNLDSASIIGVTCAKNDVFAENAKEFKDNFVSDS